MSAAHAIPAGPEPTTATRNPLGSTYGTLSQSSAIARSPTNRSSRPIATGSSVLPTVHTPSHCASCGQTRPQIAGSRFVSVIVSYAPRRFFSVIFKMNSGMSISTGQPRMHGSSGQIRHRSASRSASSSV